MIIEANIYLVLSVTVLSALHASYNFVNRSYMTKSIPWSNKLEEVWVYKKILFSSGTFNMLIHMYKIVTT